MDKPFAITLDVGSSLANRTGSWRTERPVYVHRLPPCANACPAGENVQQWLYDAEEGSAGYERAYMPKEDTWVATLPVGHTDGWPRVAAKGARVRINGTRYPVVASISASHTIVELTPATGAHATASPVQIGDEVTLFDWEEGSRPEDVGKECGASVYDLTMHLNPLLPRRIIN